ncbi:MAG: hypothetical protein EOO68_10210, partial [Moraxellaceae bacterium]
MNKILSQWIRSAGRLSHSKTLVSAACGLALAMSADAAVQPITTQGNQVLFGGQPGSVAGMSMFWDIWGFEKYYNASTVGWLAQDWKAKLVRAAIAVEEGGADSVLSNPAIHKARVKAVVDAATALGIPWQRLNERSLIQLGYGKNRKFIQATQSWSTRSI